MLATEAWIRCMICPAVGRFSGSRAWQSEMSSAMSCKHTGRPPMTPPVCNLLTRAFSASPSARAPFN